jgi:hypothetical protein
LDIFFTHSYQYILEEDAGSVAARITESLTRPGSRGGLLAENGFRLGHPWGLWSIAYLSGSLDAMKPRVVSSDPPQYQSRTLVDIRIRPNLFLVVTAYVLAVLLMLDMMGIELFMRSNYLLRLLLLCAAGITSVWAIFFSVGQLRKQFESLLVSPLAS